MIARCYECDFRWPIIQMKDEKFDLTCLACRICTSKRIKIIDAPEIWKRTMPR